MAGVLRADFQKIAGLRLKEARVLLKARLYDGAYHVAGYAVECGLKACIAKKVAKYQFPDKNARDLYTHEIPKLVNYAGLLLELKNAKSNPDFDTNWSIVTKWNPETRYAITKSKTDANGLYRAITSKTHGVMKWIRQHW